MPAFPRALDRPYLLLTLTALFWGGNAVAGRLADGTVSPMWLTFGRWALAVVVLGWLARHAIRREAPLMRRHWRYLAVMGTVGFTFFNFLLYTAAKHTSAVNVALLQSAMPLFIFALGFAAYRTPVTWMQAVGFTLTAAGVWVTATAGDVLAPLRGGADGFNRGDAIMLLAALAYASYSVGLKAKPALSPLTLLFALTVAAFLAAAVGLVAEIAAGTALFPQGAVGWGVVVYAGVFAAMLAQAFFIRGVEAVGANVAGLFINLVPVFAALLSVLILGEALEPFHAAAFVLVVGGVWLAGRR